MPARVCLIVNPAAGGSRAGRAAPAVEQALRGHGLQVRRVDTRDLDHARELAAEAANRGETVVALSGDGMIGVLADTLREIPGAVLGVLPGGRGNDLARVLGIAEDPVAACATIAHGVPRPIDLGVVIDARSGEGGRAFVGIASAGFDSDANRIANEAPSWLGGLVYAYGALRALLSWRPARLEIELDPPGERHAFTGYTVAAANSKAYGGGMRLAPDALLDDGLLEVIVVERVSKLAVPGQPAASLQGHPRAAALRAGLPRRRGRHLRGPAVHDVRRRRPDRRAARARPCAARCRIRADARACRVGLRSAPPPSTAHAQADGGAPSASSPRVSPTET